MSCMHAYLHACIHKCFIHTHMCFVAFALVQCLFVSVSSLRCVSLFDLLLFLLLMLVAAHVCAALYSNTRLSDVELRYTQPQLRAYSFPNEVVCTAGKRTSPTTPRWGTVSVKGWAGGQKQSHRDNAAVPPNPP